MATKLQIWNRAARAAGETRRIESEADTTPVATALADVFDDFVREALSAKEWPWATAQSALTEVGEQSVSYTGDAAQTAFSVPYDIGADASLLAVTVNGAVLELGTGYSYTPPDGGFAAIVTFAVAPAVSAAIVLTVTTTRVGWDFVFTLPDDCLRPLALLHEGERRVMLRPEARAPFAIVPNNGRTASLLCADDNEFEVLEYTALIMETSLYPPHFVEALVRRLAAHLLDAIKKAPAEAKAMLERYEEALADAMVVANSSAGQMPVLESRALASRW